MSGFRPLAGSGMSMLTEYMAAPDGDTEKAPLGVPTLPCAEIWHGAIARSIAAITLIKYVVRFIFLSLFFRYLDTRALTV